MVINHVPANAPSHMRQTIGLESAAACTSMYNGSHPWANDGPIFVVVRVIGKITLRLTNISLHYDIPLTK